MPQAWVQTWPAKAAANRARIGQVTGVLPPRFSTAGKSHRVGATYQWYVGGKPVAGATSRYFLVKSDYRNKVVALRVTIEADGYQSFSRTIGFGRPS